MNYLRKDIRASIKLLRLNKARGYKQAVIDIEDKISVLFSLREKVGYINRLERGEIAF